MTDHQSEQLEAAQRDFARAWLKPSLPSVSLEQLCLSFGYRTPRDLAFIHDIAWHAFKAGMEAGKEKKE